MIEFQSNELWTVDRGQWTIIRSDWEVNLDFDMIADNQLIL